MTRFVKRNPLFLCLFSYISWVVGETRCPWKHYVALLFPLWACQQSRPGGESVQGATIYPRYALLGTFTGAQPFPLTQAQSTRLLSFRPERAFVVYDQTDSSRIALSTASFAQKIELRGLTFHAYMVSWNGGDTAQDVRQLAENIRNPCDLFPDPPALGTMANHVQDIAENVCCDSSNEILVHVCVASTGHLRMDPDVIVAPRPCPLRLHLVNVGLDPVVVQSGAEITVLPAVTNVDDPSPLGSLVLEARTQSASYFSTPFIEQRRFLQSQVERGEQLPARWNEGMTSRLYQTFRIKLRHVQAATGSPPSRQAADVSADVAPPKTRSVASSLPEEETLTIGFWLAFPPWIRANTASCV